MRLPKPDGKGEWTKAVRKMVRTSSSIEWPLAAAANRSLILRTGSMFLMVSVDNGGFFQKMHATHSMLAKTSPFASTFGSSRRFGASHRIGRFSAIRKYLRSILARLNPSQCFDLWFGSRFARFMRLNHLAQPLRCS